MNLKSIITKIFLGSLGLLTLSFLLSTFFDCSTPISGIGVGLNSLKNRFCGFIKIIKYFGIIGIIVGVIGGFVYYFVFKGKGDNY